MALEGGETVPPENSAVNQYTEAFPTAGGDREAHGQRGKNLSPGKVIGAANAKKLNEQGAAGRATAKLAADTAPRGIAEGPSSAGAGSGPGGNVTTTPGNQGQGTNTGVSGGGGNGA